jgi:hypothetical protein
MEVTPYSWKSKIDPDFDITVKTFLKSIREVKNSSANNYLVVKDEVLQLILDGQGIAGELPRFLTELYFSLLGDFLE